jgi:hypothetical protein
MYLFLNQNQKGTTRRGPKIGSRTGKCKTDFSLERQMVQQRGSIQDSVESQPIESTINVLKANQERAALQIKEIQADKGPSDGMRKQKETHSFLGK